MREAIIHKDLQVEIIDSLIPEPGPDQVVTKVVVSGSNPKDWKVPEWTSQTLNHGDDIAGIVHKVGANVTEFKPGDRVAAFHEMVTPGGSYAEYALSWAYTTFHIPNNISFEEASTLPLASMTAAVGLYQSSTLSLPPPWSPHPPSFPPTPLIIYGASTAVGAYALQLASLSNVHPIIAVAGRGIPFVRTLLDESKGDKVVDYRSGNVVAELKKALGGEGVRWAFDAVSERGSYGYIGEVMRPPPKLTTVLFTSDYSALPPHIQHSQTSVGSVHKDAQDFGYVFFRYFSRLLADGRLRPHPHEVVPGGLGGVETVVRRGKGGRAGCV
ncbi:GroES-like protein [Patellaria atrata CBS 101060]|uniref:GroES-like protein n=1 Tax=Patellaria atrata CBS 101060 TaxID=1346257 RepID=A0A9P4SFN5_9PEZI|nr:GroES-like protein [Patellaria atrata CBS 101060]